MGHYGPGAGPHDNNLPPNTNQITIPIPRNIVGLSKFFFFLLFHYLINNYVKRKFFF